MASRRCKLGLCLFLSMLVAGKVGMEVSGYGIGMQSV